MPRSKTLFATVHREIREEQTWSGRGTPLIVAVLRKQIKQANDMKRIGCTKWDGMPLRRT